MTKQDVKAKLDELSNEFFNRLRDEVGEPLEWSTVEYFLSKLISETLRHRQGYRGM